MLGAVRIGDTVRRPAQTWTPAVHAVLRHLEAAGCDGVPRVLGFDAAGREILTYLHGQTIGLTRPWTAWVRSDPALVQVGRWMRRLHDLTAAFVPDPGLTWFAGQTWRPGLIIGHHDATPWNAVWQDDHLVGFVDWDTAGPSSPEFDLAFTALSWVPLHTQSVAHSLGFTAVQDRARRLRLLLDAYGYDGNRATFGGVVATRARVNATAIRRLAAAGDPNCRALIPFAADLEQAAHEVEALPPSFWHDIDPRPTT